MHPPIPNLLRHSSQLSGNCEPSPGRARLRALRSLNTWSQKWRKFRHPRNMPQSFVAAYYSSAAITRANIATNPAAAQAIQPVVDGTARAFAPLSPPVPSTALILAPVPSVGSGVGAAVGSGAGTKEGASVRRAEEEKIVAKRGKCVASGVAGGVLFPPFHGAGARLRPQRNNSDLECDRGTKLLEPGRIRLKVTHAISNGYCISSRNVQLPLLLMAPAYPCRCSREVRDNREICRFRRPRARGILRQVARGVQVRKMQGNVTEA